MNSISIGNFDYFFSAVHFAWISMWAPIERVLCVRWTTITIATTKIKSLAAKFHSQTTWGSLRLCCYWTLPMIISFQRSINSDVHAHSPHIRTIQCMEASSCIQLIKTFFIIIVVRTIKMQMDYRTAFGHRAERHTNNLMRTIFLINNATETKIEFKSVTDSVVCFIFFSIRVK